jgi:hypothetical protein
MVHHNIDNPAQFLPSKERHFGKYAAVVLGSATLAAILANGLQSDPKFDIKNDAQLSVPATIEHAATPSQEYTDSILINKIEQDEITGLVVEQSTLEFADEYDVTLQPGQSDIDFLSAKSIEEAVRQVTGGSVQPGTAFETRLDPETGYIVSTYLPDTSE